MAKGIITSFSVQAATNGYTLNYCIKTKQAPAAGQTYCNTDYKDMVEVFAEKDAKLLIDRLSDMLGVIDDGEAKEEAGEEDKPVMSKE